MPAQRLALVPSATRVSNGAGSPFVVSTATMMFVALEITAENLTGFTCWLQGSDDGGTTWYDLVADHVLDHTGIEIGGTVLTLERDICDDTGIVGLFMAIYKHLPVDTIRIAWDIDGTDITFAVNAVVK